MLHFKAKVDVCICEKAKDAANKIKITVIQLSAYHTYKN